MTRYLSVSVSVLRGRNQIGIAYQPTNLGKSYQSVTSVVLVNLVARIENIDV